MGRGLETQIREEMGWGGMQFLWDLLGYGKEIAFLLWVRWMTLLDFEVRRHTISQLNKSVTVTAVLGRD